MITTEIIIDIETTSHVSDEMRDYLSANIKPRANIRNAEKLADDIERKRMAIYERAALSPLTGMVAVFGFIAASDDGTEKKEILTTRDMTERELLEQASDIMMTLDPRRIITYNGREFDMKFLAARSMVHMIGGYRWPLGYHPMHIDLCDYLDGSLDAWSVAIRREKKSTPSADIPALIAAGEWDEVITHCAGDIMLTSDLYHRMIDVADIRRWR